MLAEEMTLATFVEVYLSNGFAADSGVLLQHCLMESYRSLCTTRAICVMVSRSSWMDGGTTLEVL